MSNQPVHKTVLRLDQQAYRDLEKQLPQPVVGQNDNPQSSAYRLGIQHVLQKLRDGFVTGG